MSKLEKIPLLQEIKHLLAHAAGKYFVHVRLVEGKLPDCDQSFRCLFAGKSHFTKWLESNTYSEPPTVIWQRRMYIPAFRSIVQSNPDAADLIVAVIPRQYETKFEGLYHYKGTELVRQTITTTGTWDEVRLQFSVRKRRTSNHIENKFGLKTRVSHDLKDLEFFYNRMYIPHIRKRHGEFAQIDTFEEQKRHFDKGMLMFTTKDDKVLAGNLCNIEDGILYLRRVGVLDGDESLIEAGLQTAVYHFSIKYANENNLRAADAMMSMPFLNDGVYNTKKEWGATVSPSDDYNTWVYFINKGPYQKLMHFYAKHPFIAISENSMKGVVGEILGDSQTLEETLNRYRSRGLSGFHIHTKNGVTEIKETS